MNNILGERIKELRLKKGLSQKKLAEQLNTNQQRIANYENCIREPNYEMLLKICDFFKVSPNYLLGYYDNSNKLVYEIEQEEKIISSEYIAETILENHPEILIEKIKSLIIGQLCSCIVNTALDADILYIIRDINSMFMELTDYSEDLKNNNYEDFLILYREFKHKIEEYCLLFLDKDFLDSERKNYYFYNTDKAND